MHQDEPSLLTHFNEVRANALPEGGLSTVVFCGKLQFESDLSSALQMHQEIVEEEVNKEQVKVTGMLLGQVYKIDHSSSDLWQTFDTLSRNLLAFRGIAFCT
jgi:hypothetical protein